ncbi:MAG: fused signal recognition particle receptor, partial [Verrucomicrobia bacterium]
YLIVDTAGRLHTKGHLMDELAKIRRVLQKNDPTAPQHRWLVVDGSLGTNSIEQAKVFHASFGLTGLVVTKLDGTSRGGALVGIWRQLKIPIYFLGLGEQAEDLQPFSVENYSKAVFGLGD